MKNNDITNKILSMFLFGLWFNVPVNSYGHVKTLHTHFFSGLA